jgi:hypothetical protein
MNSFSKNIEDIDKKNHQLEQKRKIATLLYLSSIELMPPEICKKEGCPGTETRVHY